jgi:hypothetical protein
VTYLNHAANRHTCRLTTECGKFSYFLNLHTTADCFSCIPARASVATAPLHRPSPPPLATAPRHLPSPPPLATAPRHRPSLILMLPGAGGLVVCSCTTSACANRYAMSSWLRPVVMLLQVPSKDFPALFPAAKSGGSNIAEVGNALLSQLIEIMLFVHQMKATGYDLTKILRAVNVKQQRGSSKQQGQEQASESKQKAAEDEICQKEQEEPQDDDEASPPSKITSLPKAAALLQSGGCYVCGRSSAESGSIFVPMSNEGQGSCAAAACSNVM